MSTATPEKPLTVYSREQVAEHNKAGDSWMIINQEVYDVTGFESEHPGGGKSTLVDIHNQRKRQELID